MHKCNKEADIKHIQWLQFLKSVEFVGVAWPGLILMKLKPHVPWSANEKQFPFFEDNEYTAGIYFYPLLHTKMENTTPIQKQIINPLIRVDQLKVVASDI